MLNRIILIGRLVRDPELRYTPSGVAVTQFTLAVERSFTNQEGKKEADFINIVTWRQLAEAVANSLKKGRLVATEGRLQIRNYVNNEGRKVYVPEVIADNVRFLDSANKTNGNGQANGVNMQAQPDPFADDGKPINISDDDLPF